MIGKFKLKSRILAIILMILFAILGSNTLAEGEEGTVEEKRTSIWFLYYPGSSVGDLGVAIGKGDSDDKGWFAIDNVIFQGNSKTNLKPIQDNNYYYVETAISTGKQGKILSQLSEGIEINKNYNIRMWYANTGDSSVDIYLTKKKPEGEEIIDDDFIANETQLLKTLAGTNSNTWNFLDLDFTSQFSVERAYILFVPKNGSVKGIFAIDQGHTNIINKSIDVKDNGIKYLGTTYKQVYGINDGEVVKEETVQIKIKLENKGNGIWRGKEKIVVDYSKFGERTADTPILEWYYAESPNDRTQIDIEGEQFFLDEGNDDQQAIFIINNTNKDKGLDGGKIYELTFDVVYQSEKPQERYKPYIEGYYYISNEEGVLEESSHITTNFEERVDLSEKNKDNQVIQGIGEHNIIKIPLMVSQGETTTEQLVEVKLGSNISSETSPKSSGADSDDGWIKKENISENKKGFFARNLGALFSKKENLAPNERELFLGANTIYLKASHDGYVGGFAELGEGTGSNVKYHWERIFIEKVKGGSSQENKIDFVIPDGVDTIRGVILKYSLRQNEAGVFNNNSNSGEIENYIIKPKQIFDGEIVSIKENGIKLATKDDNTSVIFGAGDGIYSYNEEVVVTLKLSNR